MPARKRYTPKKETVAAKGRPLGYASLDDTGKVPVAQIPGGGGGGSAPIASATTTGTVKTNTTTADPIVYRKSEVDSLLAAKLAATDPSVTNARTPTAHAASHAAGGSDPVSIASIGAAGIGHTHPESDVIGLTADLAAKLSATDPSVTNARTPTAHASSHGSGGSDPVTPAAIGAALASHVHAAADITSGLLPTSRGGTAADGSALGANVILASPSGASGAASYRAMTPLDVPALPESAITNLVSDLAGKLSSTDPSVTNARTPVAHKTSHQLGGSDALNVGGLSGVLADPQPPIIGATATTAVAGNDTRLTNARTPSAHAASHASGGADPVTPAAIGAMAVGAAPTAHAASHNAGGSDALAIDAVAATGSLRTLGTGAAQAAQGSVLAAHTAASAPHSGHALLSHTHAAADITTGLLPTSRGGTAADGSSLPANQFLASSTAAAGAAATYRAIDPLDIPALPESKITNLVTDLAAKETARLQARMTADQAAIGTTATALTGLSLALAAATHYRFHAVIMYLCAVTTATLAARVAHSGTLGTNASGESLYKVYGSSGVPTVWAAVAKETTQIVSAAIITATGGPGASGSATVPCMLEIEGDIFTGTAGNLTIQIVSSAAAGIAPQADSHLEAWVMT